MLRLFQSGAAEARCIDAVRLSDVGGNSISAPIKGNRPDCQCFQSRDIRRIRHARTVVPRMSTSPRCAAIVRSSCRFPSRRNGGAPEGIEVAQEKIVLHQSCVSSECAIYAVVLMSS